MSEEDKYNETGNGRIYTIPPATSLRDEFAMHAMNGMVYDLNRRSESSQSSIDEVAAHAYRMADAMIAESERKKT